MKNPCKHCLKLPVCIGNNHPKCSILDEYIDELILRERYKERSLMTSDTHIDLAFQKIRKTLPNLR